MCTKLITNYTFVFQLVNDQRSLLGFVEGIKRKPWTEIETGSGSKRGAFVRDLDEYLSFARDVVGYLRVLRHVADASLTNSMGVWIGNCMNENENIIIEAARKQLLADSKNEDETNPELKKEKEEEEIKTDLGSKELNGDGGNLADPLLKTE